jgi:predicted small lipoprotein YifL
MRKMLSIIALALLPALSACQSVSPVVLPQAKAPAPPQALMVAPPEQTSLLRLQAALQK